MVLEVTQPMLTTIALVLTGIMAVVNAVLTLSVGYAGYCLRDPDVGPLVGLGSLLTFTFTLAFLALL